MLALHAAQVGRSLRPQAFGVGFRVHAVDRGPVLGSGIGFLSNLKLVFAACELAARFFPRIKSRRPYGFSCAGIRIVTRCRFHLQG